MCTAISLDLLVNVVVFKYSVHIILLNLVVTLSVITVVAFTRVVQIRRRPICLHHLEDPAVSCMYTGSQKCQVGVNRVGAWN